MLSESELEAKSAELGEDVLYLHGHAIKQGLAWQILLKPPALLAWQGYQAHKEQPDAQFALIQSMVAWCGSDAVKVPDDPKQAFAAVRTRFVGVAEAIGQNGSFQRFIGLEVGELEK